MRKYWILTVFNIGSDDKYAFDDLENLCSFMIDINNDYSLEHDMYIEQGWFSDEKLRLLKITKMNYDKDFSDF